MGKRETRKELDALLKTAEKNRVALQKTWKKVEDLDAAIQAARRANDEAKSKSKER